MLVSTGFIPNVVDTLAITLAGTIKYNALMVIKIRVPTDLSRCDEKTQYDTPALLCPLKKPKRSDCVQV